MSKNTIEARPKQGGTTKTTAIGSGIHNRPLTAKTSITNATSKLETSGYEAPEKVGTKCKCFWNDV